jgi:hypothetical protein
MQHRPRRLGRRAGPHRSPALPDSTASHHPTSPRGHTHGRYHRLAKALKDAAGAKTSAIAASKARLAKLEAVTTLLAK